AGVTRRAVDFIHERALAQLPRQRVLSSSGTNHQYIHRVAYTNEKLGFCQSQKSPSKITASRKGQLLTRAFPAFTISTMLNTGTGYWCHLQDMVIPGCSHSRESGNLLRKPLEMRRRRSGFLPQGG